MLFTAKLQIALEVGEMICKFNFSEGLVCCVAEEIEPDAWTLETYFDKYTHALLYKGGKLVVPLRQKLSVPPML